MKNKVIVVVGPTAVGKTKIAIELAKHYHLEIISGDSVAVYKGLDIGSAKPTLEEQSGIPHHLIDVLEPTQQYSSADFQRAARKIMDHQPISMICGGTGLYIQSAIFNYEFEVAKRNASFDAQYQSYSNEELYKILLDKDPKINPDRVHPNNRKRVLRALEVIEETGVSITSFDKKSEPIYDYFIVYLKMDREKLYERINRRVDIMVENGLIEEVKDLYDRGIYPTGIGYQEFKPYFDGEISLETAISDIKLHSRHLAKRQETWFRNQMDAHFYDVCLDNVNQTIEEIKKDIDEWMEVQ